MIANGKAQITGVILAGGQARRMNGRDKGLIKLKDRTLIDYVLTAFKSQVDSLLINANRNIDNYKELGYPVISDNLNGFNGPLAGVACSMVAAPTGIIVTVPCDSPFLASDLVSRLYETLQNKKVDISVAHDGERLQPAFSMYKTKLLDSLSAFLDRGERKMDKWFEEHQVGITDFSDNPEAFLNINTPEDLDEIQHKVALYNP